eukprot:CAMPEP_0168594536 /NCGR_PEP_ID=MMETSP0420-20121227/8955_1 /TAXON_ID=498008 /ORGANISM="Pessonella sp." /LENGTH=700 /DNA_ID=CAMNT_0008630871 /DNA_START=65 /DNA_END=2169 /DNA_ORIENTATION=-
MKGNLKKHELISVNVILCDVCEEDDQDPAVVLCQQCNLHYCSECQSSVHPHMGALKSHVLLPVNDAPPPVPPEDLSLAAPPPLMDAPPLPTASPPAIPAVPPPLSSSQTTQTTTDDHHQDNNDTLTDEQKTLLLEKRKSFLEADAFKEGPNRPPPTLRSSPSAPAIPKTDAPPIPSSEPPSISQIRRVSVAEARIAADPTGGRVSIKWLAVDGLVTREFERKADDDAPDVCSAARTGGNECAARAHVNAADDDVLRPGAAASGQSLRKLEIPSEPNAAAASTTTTTTTDVENDDESATESVDKADDSGASPLRDAAPPLPADIDDDDDDDDDAAAAAHQAKSSSNSNDDDDGDADEQSDGLATAIRPGGNDDSSSDEERPATAIGEISLPDGSKKDDDVSAFESIFKAMAPASAVDSMSKARARHANGDDSDSDKDAPLSPGRRSKHSSSRGSRKQSSRRQRTNSNAVRKSVESRGSERTPRSARGEPRTPRRHDDKPAHAGQSSSRRRHHDPRAVRERRNALMKELEECRAKLSDPNTVDGAPIRARMGAVETELREVNKEMDALQIAGNVLSGATTAQSAVAAAAEAVTPRRRGREVLFFRLLCSAPLIRLVLQGQPPPPPSKPMAEALKALQIKKMMLAGQMGAIKKQLQSPTLSITEKQLLTGSVEQLESEMAAIDVNIKNLQPQKPATTIAIQQK